MTRMFNALFAALALWPAARPTSSMARARTSTTYDLVILNGRVMDPASGLDAIRNVGITRGRIAAITIDAMHGRDTVNATSLVVAPGFIDLHQHAQDSASYTVEVTGGVTSAFELEDGTGDVDRWYAERAGRSVINHGVSIGEGHARMIVMHDTGPVPSCSNSIGYKSNTRQVPA
jgi:predicted amidohydrolase YtcJ